MLTVTRAAKEYLVALKVKANLSRGDVALRMVKDPLGRLGLLPDVQRPDDHVVEHEGMKALLVGREQVAPLKAAVIDAIPTPDGFGLVVRRFGRPSRDRKELSA